MQPSFEQLLLQTQLVSAPQLAVAQRDAEIRQRPLAQTLIDLGFVSDRRFAEWISEVTKLPIVDPLRADVVSEFEGHVPPEVAREHEIVPLDVNADEMTIATVNPLDRASIDAVHSATGLKIQPVIALYSQLTDLVKRFYPEPPKFDASATIAVTEVEPFHFGDDTMLKRHSLEFAYNRGDDSLGSETRVLPPLRSIDDLPPLEVDPSQEMAPPLEAAAPETQLDRIERYVTELIRVIDTLQRRVDAIDATLARIVNRER
ncbi:MAG TPA: hypothetical protein VF980_14490 [Thermoanaerobaculia bacterium]